MLINEILKEIMNIVTHSDSSLDEIEITLSLIWVAGAEPLTRSGECRCCRSRGRWPSCTHSRRQALHSVHWRPSCVDGRVFTILLTFEATFYGKRCITSSLFLLVHVHNICVRQNWYMLKHLKNGIFWFAVSSV